MQLHYQHFPENLLAEELQDPAPVIIIPGLFGSTANWRSFAKKLSAHKPVIVVDQRNHGRSSHASSNSYADMVADLIELCDRLHLDKAIFCGHSMGGKVAMKLALDYPERVEKLLVLDIAPVKYSHSHAPFLNALGELDLSSLKSRKEADQVLTDIISDTPTRLFLLQNLRGSPGSYAWRINIPVLSEYMEEITGFPSSTSTVNVPTLFLYGDLSTYVRSEHYDIIHQYFRNAVIESVKDAGHWLHAEQPAKVLLAVTEFVNK